jgi:hypothetical protein
LTGVIVLVPTTATLSRAATGMSPANRPARSTPSRPMPKYQATNAAGVATASQASAAASAPVGIARAARPSSAAAPTASIALAMAQA